MKLEDILLKRVKSFEGSDAMLKSATIPLKNKKKVKYVECFLFYSVL